MLNEIVMNIIEENRKARQAHRAKVEKRAEELNAGWCKSRYGRDGFDKVVEPTWGIDDRPHAPFDGYLWENELGEVEAYHAGSYLPYVTELDNMDKPVYTGEHGWWKLRLTQEMYDEIFEIYGIQFQAPYKRWTMEQTNTEVMMVKVRAHQDILKAIQAYSTEWFNKLFESMKEGKGEAPTGKLVVKGRVVSVKTFEDFYGVVSKMTVVLENKSTVYGTLPKCVPLDFRGEIEFSATFEQTRDDKTHAFFKRPVKVKI